MLILLFFSLLSFLPSILNPPTPPPAFSFEASAAFPTQRLTSPHQVPYYVSPAFDSHPIGQSLPDKHKTERQAARYSTMLKSWEQEIETDKIRQLQSKCRWEMQNKERNLEAKRGFLGIGADWDEIRRSVPPLRRLDWLSSRVLAADPLTPPRARLPQDPVDTARDVRRAQKVQPPQRQPAATVRVLLLGDPVGARGRRPRCHACTSPDVHMSPPVGSRGAPLWTAVFRYVSRETHSLPVRACPAERKTRAVASEGLRRRRSGVAGTGRLASALPRVTPRRPSALASQRQLPFPPSLPTSLPTPPTR